MRISSFAVALIPALTLATSGCLVESNDRVVPASVVITNGTLIVDWTINGYKDPSLCTQSAAAAIHIDVTTTSGQTVGSYQQDCVAFATSVTLSPGSYVASALLVDAAGRARTTAVNLDPFTIRGNDNLTTPIDFPSSSFY